jgi:hypothetical protein
MIPALGRVRWGDHKSEVTARACLKQNKTEKTKQNKKRARRDGASL